MRKLLIGLMVLGLAGMCWANVHYIDGGTLKQSTAITIPVGPFEEAAPDGDFVAPTISDLNFTIIKSDGSVTEDDDLTGVLVLITATGGTDYWYTLAISAANTDTLGAMSLTIWDDGADAISPMVYRFKVKAAKPYNLEMSGTVDVDTILTAAPVETTEIAESTWDVVIDSAVSNSTGEQLQSISTWTAAQTVPAEFTSSVNPTGSTAAVIVLDTSPYSTYGDLTRCWAIYTKASTSLKYPCVVTASNVTGQSVKIFPSLPFTPLTADSIMIFPSVMGLIRKDLPAPNNMYFDADLNP